MKFVFIHQPEYSVAEKLSPFVSIRDNYLQYERERSCVTFCHDL